MVGHIKKVFAYLVGLQRLSNSIPLRSQRLLPLCLAVRPCSVTNPEGTFGGGVSFGVFFGGLQVQVFPGLKFVFYGIGTVLSSVIFGAICDKKL